MSISTALNAVACCCCCIHPQVEDLDFALRKKDQDSAASKLVAVQTSLDKALAKLL